MPKTKLSCVCPEFHVVLKQDGHGLASPYELVLQFSNLLLEVTGAAGIIPIATLKGTFSVLEKLLLPCVVLRWFDAKFVAKVGNRSVFDQMLSNCSHFFGCHKSPS